MVKKITKKVSIPKNSPDYPYYKNEYILDPEKIINLVTKMNLRITSKPVLEKKKRHPNHLKSLVLFSNHPKVYIIQSPWEDYVEINSLTDYFSEDCRVECQFLNNPRPLDYWRLNYKDILLKANKSRTSPREILYHSIRLCNNFRISVAITVLRLFRATKWLDISAGWGDRLLAALLTPTIKFYCGVDPNPCLHDRYKEMINVFGDSTASKNYVLIKDGFESAKIPDVGYDLVFSSPPFFNLETYSQSVEDSLVKNPTSKQWFENFLMPSIYKAISHLVKNGYLILYMGESKATNYVKEMKVLVNKRLSYSGSLYYQDANTIREFFVWKKINI
jgi:hypothetical protein